MHTALKTVNLTVGYPGKGQELEEAILPDLNLSLYPGELTVLMGPNGSGKSTLLRTLCGLQSALNGEVMIQGQSIGTIKPPDLAKQIAVVLTDKLYPMFLTVHQLVALGRSPHTNRWGSLTEEDHQVVDRAMIATGIQKFKNRNILALSDGERQKVMIARALAQNPSVLILDEPTAYLDLVGKIEIFSLLRDTARDHAIAVLLSTHDFDISTKLVDRVWLVQADRTVSDGAPEDLMLSGAFKKTFRKKNLAFDEHTGSFTPEIQPHHAVTLRGEGLQYEWTATALSRSGFSVADESRQGQCIVSVFEEGGSIRWSLEKNAQSTDHHSIYELIHSLKYHYSHHE